MSITTETLATAPAVLKQVVAVDDGKSRCRAPFAPNGKVDAEFEGKDVSPIIGREYKDVQLSEWLSRPDSDDLIRDLASIISHRNVVFFRNQNISATQMLKLGERLHELAGAPSASSHHVHPITNETSELGVNVYTINSMDYKKRTMGTDLDMMDSRNKFASSLWHSDITWEPVPSDYAMLKIHTTPEAGGDTMWGSAYEVYDRLSPALAKMLEGLEAVHDGTMFYAFAKGLGKTLLTDIERGNPLNIGPELTAVHPCIRTNPVTGWKGVFINQSFTKKIIGLTKMESDWIIAHCHQLLIHNHDLQCRMRWAPNDLAIWDNRSSFHSATQDFNPEDIREGNRVCTLGEKPYFDSASVSRRQALAESMAKKTLPHVE